MIISQTYKKTVSSKNEILQNLFVDTHHATKKTIKEGKIWGCKLTNTNKKYKNDWNFYKFKI